MKKERWRRIARNYGSLSGILAGFCIAFITFFLISFQKVGANLTDELVVIFFAGAAFLFITAAERYFLSIFYDEVKKYNLACALYNGGIILMLVGLLFMLITFGLFWAPIAVAIILMIETYLVVKAYY